MESLGIDIKLLIAQAINFALFFYIFKKFIAKPFSNFLADEVKKEQEKEKILVDLKDKEELMIVNQNKTKLQMKKELDEAIKKSKQEASLYKTKLVAEAGEEAEEIIVKAKKQIETEKKQAEKEIKNKVAQLSNMLISQSFDKYLSVSAQKEITKNILKNLPKNIN